MTALSTSERMNYTAQVEGLALEAQQCICSRLWCRYLQAVESREPETRKGLWGRGNWQPTCPEGWLFLVVVPSTSGALVEAPFQGAGSSEHMLGFRATSSESRERVEVEFW